MTKHILLLTYYYDNNYVDVLLKKKYDISTRNKVMKIVNEYKPIDNFISCEVRVISYDIDKIPQHIKENRIFNYS